jgi:hypothetical protein
VTGSLISAEVVNTYPSAFIWENIAGAAGVFFSDRGKSPIEASQAYKLLLGNRVDEMFNLNYGGSLRMRGSDEQCTFGFELPATKEALLYEVAVHTPVHPDRRKRIRQSLLQVRSGAAGQWTDVFSLATLEVSGATIPQGWSTLELPSPVVAQHFRIVLGPDACQKDDPPAAFPSAFTTELVRSVRFNGVVLDKGPSVADVRLAEVRHPLALASWNTGLAVAKLEHLLSRTPRLTCPISPNQGTARGGTFVSVCGENLAPVMSGAEIAGAAAAVHAKVWFNGYPCYVQTASSTAIGCTTAPRVDGITPSAVSAAIAGKGFALVVGLREEKYFQYIDQWSDHLSWAESDFPVDGDSVQVPEGQAILLDQDSPRLFLLLIQGLMEFDRKDLTLEATYIWISGGHLRIGSEERPFMNQALIQMYGDRWKTIELPYVGAKMIAVTNRGGLGDGKDDCSKTTAGTFSSGSSRIPTQCQVQSVGKIDFHGRPDTSWTRIVRTAEPGADRLQLAEAVAWLPGSRIVITPSKRGETEEVRLVQSVIDDGFTVVLDEPVKHQHLGTWYWHPEVTGPTDLRAAVGLMTKNIVIRANESSLYGRNPDYLFGVAVHAFFGGELRIENVEFTRTGQAANFGRYSSHWHKLSPGRNVDVVDKAYLRNNSYHDTFQRCVVIHATDHGTVKDNVCHRSHGHGIFTEAGDEDYALVEHNLVINPKPHPLLLNDDLDPAGFWLPGFTGWHRHNMAANCHRGWRVKNTGSGGSQTGFEFFNNSAHASGFGWHLKPPFAPPALQTMKDFTVFRCNTGLFYYGTGNLNHVNHRLMECGTGHFNNFFFSGLHQEPFYTDAVLVGNIDLDVDQVGAGHSDGVTPAQAPGGTCTSRVGLGFRWTKQGENTMGSGITAINFCNTPVMYGCFKDRCTVRIEKFAPTHTYVYTNNEIENSGIYWDLDGSLTGMGPNSFVTWDEEYNHWPDLCKWDDTHHKTGVVCGAADGKLRLRKLTLDAPKPTQLVGKNVRIKTEAGMSDVSWDFKLFSWMVPVVSYFKNGYSDCTSGALEYDLWPKVWNTIEELGATYSGSSKYITTTHGYKHGIDKVYHRARVDPTDEGIMAHFNFTHDWRDHFVVESGRRRGVEQPEQRLTRRPKTCSDEFGSHAMRLWREDCDTYTSLANTTGDLSSYLVAGQTCTRFPAPTCSGEFCYYDEANNNCKICYGADCPSAKFIAGASRGACNGGYTNETGWDLKQRLDQEPLLDQVGGQLTVAMGIDSTANFSNAPAGNAFSVKVNAMLCPMGGCPKPLPKPEDEWNGGVLWSDPTVWPDGKLPGHMEKVTVDFDVCFDSKASMAENGSVVLDWVMVQPGSILNMHVDCDPNARRLQGGIGPNSHLRLNVRSLIVWGTLLLGTPEAPVPLSSSVTVAFYGGLFDSNTVAVTEGLFVRNKVLVVLGSLKAHGSIEGGERWNGSAENDNDKPWKRLHATASRGSSSVVVKGNASHWPQGRKIAITPTEYPKPPNVTETEVRTIMSVTYDPASDITAITMDRNLTEIHFAGVMEDPRGHWARVELAAYVTLLEGRSNVVFTTGETDQQLRDMSRDFSLGYGETEGHGGTLVIAGSKDGELFGRANLTNVDFVRMGKRNLENPALWFYYPGGMSVGEVGRESNVNNCVFGQNMAGGVEIRGVGQSPVKLNGNVFHATTRYGVWVRGEFAGSGIEACANDVVELRNNMVIDNIKSFLDADAKWYRPFASFMIEASPAALVGNIAAGSSDAGFAIRAPVISCSDPLQSAVYEPTNEAVGCVVGFMYLRSLTSGPDACADVRLVLAWKNAHVGILTVDQSANMRMREVLVSDNHVGIHLDFVLGGGVKWHRIYGYNVTIFGSTPASSCDRSYDCKAMTASDMDGASCNSVLGTKWRRAGLMTHMVRDRCKTCQGGECKGTAIPHRWLKMCAGPWEDRRAGLKAHHSEAHWEKVTFGHFKNNECENRDQLSYAITHNPSSIDFNFPNSFSDVKYLDSVNSDSLYHLLSGTRTDDGVMQMALLDRDGTLIPGGKPNGSVIFGDNSGLARSSCKQLGNSFECGQGDPHLSLNHLLWHPDVAENRVLGYFKILRLSDNRATVSEGPHDGACPMSIKTEFRNFMITPNDVYNLTLFASTPKVHRFYYFNDRPECVKINLRLTTPFRPEVYVHDQLLDENEFDTARAFQVPRDPEFGDPHGSFIFDPHERTFTFMYCGSGLYNGVPQSLGGGGIKLVLTQVVQLTTTISVPGQDFDQNKQRTFTDNIALLLQIPSHRIKTVRVQGIGARRLEAGQHQSGRSLQSTSEVVIHILPPQAMIDQQNAGINGDTNGTNGTNSTNGSEWDPEVTNVLQGQAGTLADSVLDGTFSGVCGQSSMTCTNVQIVVTDVDAVLEPSANTSTTTTTTSTTGNATAAPGETEPDVDDATRQIVGICVGAGFGLLGTMLFIWWHRKSFDFS